MRWYINRTGTGEGPFDEPTILGMIGRGEVHSGHQICVEGQQAWQPLGAHPPFGQASAGPAPQVQAAANEFAGGVQAAANQAAPVAQEVAGGMHDAANQVAAGFGSAGAALANPQAPQFSAPSEAAPGEGFFEQAKASGQPPSEDAKKAASMAHLLAAGGSFVGCWACGLGGVIGAFVGNMLYKEEPKSPFALFHINQALQLQIAIWLVNIVTAIIFVVLRIVGGMIFDVLGLVLGFLHLFNLVLWLAGVVLPFLQSGKAKNGEWSEYPMIGARTMRAKAPMLK